MAWTDVQVAVAGVAGNTVTLSATNGSSQVTIARVAVTVTLAGGAAVTLRSENLTFGPAETKLVELPAIGPILAIDDAPEPLPPAP